MLNFKYFFKAIEVVKSCKTNEQYNVAIKYGELCCKKSYPEINNYYDTLDYLDKYKQCLSKYKPTYL